MTSRKDTAPAANPTKAIGHTADRQGDVMDGAGPSPLIVVEVDQAADPVDLARLDAAMADLLLALPAEQPDPNQRHAC